MKSSTRTATLVLVVLVGVAAAGYLALRSLFPVVILTDITKVSPDRQHRARLVTREGGFDVNVILEIDGETVYTSPDFVAPASADFREYVFWDTSGTVVVLEVAGKRLFGYDVRLGRELTVSELTGVALSSFDDLRFAHDLPKDLAPAASR